MPVGTWSPFYNAWAPGPISKRVLFPRRSASDPREHVADPLARAAALAQARHRGALVPRRGRPGHEVHLQPQLDGQYAVIGRIIEGIDVPPKLQPGDQLVRVFLRE